MLSDASAATSLCVQDRQCTAVLASTHKARAQVEHHRPALPDGWRACGGDGETADTSGLNFHDQALRQVDAENVLGTHTAAVADQSCELISV